MSLNGGKTIVHLSRFGDPKAKRGTFGDLTMVDRPAERAGRQLSNTGNASQIVEVFRLPFKTITPFRARLIDLLLAHAASPQGVLQEIQKRRGLPANPIELLAYIDALPPKKEESFSLLVVGDYGDLKGQKCALCFRKNHNGQGFDLMLWGVALEKHCLHLLVER